MDELVRKIEKLYEDFSSYPDGTTFDVDDLLEMMEELKEIAWDASADYGELEDQIDNMDSIIGRAKAVLNQY